MPAEWKIEHWPNCTAHAFLSHCAEDRDGLVEPVFLELQRRSCIPWIDRFDYPLARGAIETLREETLRCRHIVYFITPAMLRQGRGWAQAERAIAATIQDELRYGANEVQRVELPLVFVEPDDEVLLRSVWRSLSDIWQCGRSGSRRPGGGWFPRGDDGLRQWKAAHIQWAADTIEAFIRQEESWAIEIGVRLEQDSRLKRRFSGDANLLRRVLAQSPRPISIF